MLTLLINAYACSPNMGSEPGMAWNWCVNLAKHCELHIITEGEFRDKIEAVLPALPQGKNMHFYYNPIPEKIRKMCWNQGDWRFYKHYRKWQWKTYEMATEICRNTHIDILHQLNMIGFREPGYLWKIPDIPFVWGPIGGLKQFPEAYLKGAGLKMRIFNKLKNRINIYQIKHDKRVKEALHHASLLISSIPDSYKAIKKYQSLESVIIPETGCFPSEYIPTERFDEKEFHVMWAGKFDFRKQLPIAIRAVAETDNSNIILDIYGTGNEEQVSSALRLAQSLNVEKQIVWHGNQPNHTIMKAMRQAHLFLFTSVSEDTSTVVLEAISNRLPVLCFNACGMAAVIDEKVGLKIRLTNPQQSVKDFAKKITYLYLHREVLQKLSEGCRKRQKELSWENKIENFITLLTTITPPILTFNNNTSSTHCVCCNIKNAA